MSELSAILNGAAFAPAENTGWLRVTGSDRVRWLNGMVTNSIQALKPGEGNYNFLLNAQGRIQGDVTAFLLDDAIFLQTGQPGPVAALLDRYIIMDDVELSPVSNDRSGILLAGPQAPRLLLDASLPVPEQMWLEHGELDGGRAEVIGAYSPLVPRFEVWGPAGAVQALSRRLARHGVTQATPEALEHLRLLEGTPLFGTDIRDRDLPQETGQPRALHFNKGCYLGQEIVERIRSRGQVHRQFSGFTLVGELPPAGAPLESEGKPMGEITSSAAILHPTAGPVQLGLGYIRRETLERGQPIRYTGGIAKPVSLPWAKPVPPDLTSN